MPAKQATTPTAVYQLKVSLRDSKPPIWRRLEVLSTTNLAKLHKILQIAMGWTNSHLHQFHIAGQAYSDPTFELEETANEGRMTLDKLKLQEKACIQYEYDFGDDWIHDVLVEKIVSPEPGAHYPRALTGKRACPPEDCGGIWGYAELLEAIADPKHPDHDEMLEWLDEDFDPEAFDLEAVNAQLHALR